MGRLRHFTLLGLLSSLFVSPARATQAVPLSLPDLVAAADRIEIARVEEQVAQRAGDAIVTVVTVQVERSLKGGVQPGERLQVLREGGELPGVGMRVEGAAQFMLGEEVVVFLEQRGAGTWTVGMAQGKMHIETVGGRKTITRDLRGLGFLGGKPPTLGGASDKPLELQQLVQTVSDLASKPRKGGHP